MRRATGALAWLIAGGVVLVGCNGILGLDAGILDPAVCGVREECDDGNPCTLDECVDKLCIHVMLDGEDAPESEQVPGDCMRLRCDGEGVEMLSDEGDVPDDGELCTDDLCTEGMPSNVDIELGFTCDDGMGGALCDGMGSCVQCVGDSGCEDASNPSGECQTWRCVDGACQLQFEPAGTPVALQTAGDCERIVCDGNGGIDAEVDDLDVPVDGRECTADICTMGSPSNPDLPVNTACGASGALLCNDTGDCVGCGSDPDCGTSSNFCQSLICNGGVCDVVDVLDGTQLPPAQQIPGDCKLKVCIAGTAQDQEDNDPMPDGNDCTKDQCSMGANVYPPEAVNQPCSTGVCDGSGSCVDCTAPSQCPAGTNCQTPSCMANMCGLDDVPQGDPSPGGQTAGDCKEVVCDGSGGEQVQENRSDVPPDAGQCVYGDCSGTMPVQTPKSAYVQCNENGGTICDGMGACVECITDPDCGTWGDVCQGGWCSGGMGGSGGGGSGGGGSGGGTGLASGGFGNQSARWLGIDPPGAACWLDGAAH